MQIGDGGAQLCAGGGRHSRRRRMPVPVCVGIPAPNKGLLKFLSHPRWGSSLLPVLLPLLVPVRHQLTDTLPALLASARQTALVRALAVFPKARHQRAVQLPGPGEL